MIKYKDKEIDGYQDISADTVLIRYKDGKEESVKRTDLYDDGVGLEMLKGPGDQYPKVVRTIPGKEINIHVPDQDYVVPLTDEQRKEREEALKTDKASVEKRNKAVQEKAKKDKELQDKANADSKGPKTFPWSQ